MISLTKSISITKEKMEKKRHFGNCNEDFPNKKQKRLELIIRKILLIFCEFTVY